MLRFNNKTTTGLTKTLKNRVYLLHGKALLLQLNKGGLHEVKYVLKNKNAES